MDQIFSGTGLPMSSGDQVWDCPILITPVFVKVSRKIFGFTVESESINQKNNVWNYAYKMIIYEK